MRGGGFQNETLGAELHRLHALAAADRRGQHQDACRQRLIPEQTEHLEPRGIRHRHVQQQNVRREFADDGYGSGDVPGFTADAEARVGFQELSDTVPEHRMVVHEEQFDFSRFVLFHRIVIWNYRRF